MFTPIKSASPGIIALDATGKITDSDYKTVLIPAIKAAKKDHGKVSILIRFGPEYDGYTPHAMLDDTMLGITHWNDFNRVAVVTDKSWVRSLVGLQDLAMPMVDIKAFALADDDIARLWVKNGNPAATF